MLKRLSQRLNEWTYPKINHNNIEVIQKKMVVGDIIIKKAMFLVETGICIEDNLIATCRNNSIELEHYNDFLRCDSVVVISLKEIPDRDEIIRRALRRADDFIDMTDQYDVDFGKSPFKQFKRNIASMCYKELHLSDLESILSNKYKECCSTEILARLNLENIFFKSSVRKGY